MLSNKLGQALSLFPFGALLFVREHFTDLPSCA
jgi:hypothetical protein